MERGDERKKRDLNLDRIAPNHATGINNGLPASAMALSQQKHMKDLLIDEINDANYWKKLCPELRITTSSFNSAAHMEEPIKLSDADVSAKKSKLSNDGYFG